MVGQIFDCWLLCDNAGHSMVVIIYRFNWRDREIEKKTVITAYKTFAPSMFYLIPTYVQSTDT